MPGVVEPGARLERGRQVVAPERRMAPVVDRRAHRPEATRRSRGRVPQDASGLGSSAPSNRPSRCARWAATSDALHSAIRHHGAVADRLERARRAPTLRRLGARASPPGAPRPPQRVDVEVDHVLPAGRTQRRAYFPPRATTRRGSPRGARRRPPAARGARARPPTSPPCPTNAGSSLDTAPRPICVAVAAAPSRATSRRSAGAASAMHDTAAGDEHRPLGARRAARPRARHRARAERAAPRARTDGSTSAGIEISADRARTSAGSSR